ncbi:MAG: VCBS repeat-containing protein [Myxococcales bacterium]|nr:VCBS repeat-containing protein [Myxococcales bacterium]
MLPLVVGWSVVGVADDARLGGEVGAGDVNGDGWPDVLATRADPFSGALQVRVYLGSALGPSTTPDWTISGRELVATIAGDVDGDGTDDLLVGDHVGCSPSPCRSRPTATTTMPIRRSVVISRRLAT